MKLSDCKPGVRVRVYKGDVQRVVSIKNTTLDGCVIVESDGIEFNEVFHPKQLRKIVPKKDRPSIIFACKVGSWSVITDTTDECSIAEFKRQGNVVWFMRGVKRL